MLSESIIFHVSYVFQKEKKKKKQTYYFYFLKFIIKNFFSMNLTQITIESTYLLIVFSPHFP